MHSDKPFIPSPFASILPQSSSFPWKLHPPLQLSSVTGSALPTWKHLNTQSSLFTFRSFSTAQFKNVQSPEQAKLHLSRHFFKTANLKFFKKYILFLVLKLTVLHRAHTFSFHLLISLIRPHMPLARGSLQSLPSLTELR